MTEYTPADINDLKDWRFHTDFEGISWAIFDREGESMNSLGRRPTIELGAIVEKVEDAAAKGETCGLVIMSGKKNNFIAGADIREFDNFETEQQVVESLDPVIALFDRIESMRVPVVAAIHGFCLGGGLELALACHIRLASENAKFGLPEVKLGIIPGYGGTVRLPRLVGKGRALEMILTGDMIDAQEAHRIGLVNRVVPQAELLDAARELASKIMANGPVAVALALEAVENGLTATVEEAQRFESNLFGLLASTSDMREGMGAFLEKRKANFTGK